MIQLIFDQYYYPLIKILTYGLAVALCLLQTYVLFQNFFSMLILWKNNEI
jgi:hypothetical protein